LCGAGRVTIAVVIESGPRRSRKGRKQDGKHIQDHRVGGHVHAAKNAVEKAAKSVRDLRVAEVGALDLKVEKGKVVAYRARVKVSFKYEV
jgi:flavin-binding protein dodecin